MLASLEGTSYGAPMRAPLRDGLHPELVVSDLDPEMTIVNQSHDHADVLYFSV